MWAALRNGVCFATVTLVSSTPHVPAVAESAAGFAEPTAQRGPAGQRWLRFEVQQDGRTIPIKDHSAVVKRAPFDLVFYLPDKGTILVRTASQPALFDLAKSGAPLGKIFNPAQSGAFTPFNTGEDVTIDDPTLQDAWFYDSTEKDHPFNEVTPAPGGFKARRRISSIYSYEASIPIVKTDFDAMYLVMLTGASSSDSLSTIEEQRDYLKIAFADAGRSTAPRAAAPPSAPAAPSAPAPKPAAAPSRPAVFSIAVEQLASSVPMSAREVRLRKAPFDVFVDLKGIEGVYVHASFDKSIFEKAQRGEPLGSVFQRNQTMALGRFNEKHLLFINGGDSHQFWYATSRREHDFNGVAAIPGGFQGRRVIGNLWVDGAQVLVHRVPAAVLYVVFYAGTLGSEGDSEAAQRANEQQRDTLKITMF